MGVGASEGAEGQNERPEGRARATTLKRGVRGGTVLSFPYGGTSCSTRVCVASARCVDARPARPCVEGGADTRVCVASARSGSRLCRRFLRDTTRFSVIPTRTESSVQSLVTKSKQRITNPSGASSPFSAVEQQYDIFIHALISNSTSRFAERKGYGFRHAN